MSERILPLLLVALFFVCGCSDNSSDIADGDVDTAESAPDGDLDADEIAPDGDLHGGDADSDAEPESQPVYAWPGCDRVSSDTSLAAKAAYFDAVSRERHLAADNLFRNLMMDEALENVQAWYHVENVILWSGMYLGAQALRYAVTKEPEALENARRVVKGLHDLTLVTGVSGLYGRSLQDPDVAYVHRFDPATHSGWTTSTADGFEGFCFRNDVSKDGYAGLMFGYALALEHFDDATLTADIRQRIREIADHIMGHGLQIFDTGGEVTEHGRLFHSAMDDWPGFNAMLASSWIKIAHTELDDTELEDFYYGCLMDMREGIDCPDIEEPTAVGAFGLTSYIASMEEQLNLFIPNCHENYDNFDMCYQAIYPLLRREADPELRARLLGVLHNNMFHTEDGQYRSLAGYGNSFFTFAYAALTGDDPATDGMLYEAVDQAVCTLKAFPKEKFRRAIPASQQAAVCTSRLGNPRAAEPLPLSEYDFDNYLWRLDFYEMVETPIEENRRMIYSPEDYLIAYWLGRYHGILTEDQ